MKKNEKVINTLYDILFITLSIPSIFLDDLLSAIGMLGVLMLKKLTFGSDSKGTGDNELKEKIEHDNSGDKTRAAGLSGAVEFTSIETFKQGKEISGQGQKLGKRLVKVPGHFYKKNKQ